jgi:non-specific serine/threonine protein kinase
VAQDAVEMRMDAAIARADRLLARFEEAARPVRPAGGRPLRAALRREQDVWLLDYDGRSVCLQDAKGLHHLAMLFERPGTSVASVQLADAVKRGGRGRGTTVAAYRTRAQDLREELAEAQAFNDPERISRMREELEALADAMSRADDATSAAGERARINVTRAIKAAVRRIAEHEPELGHLLRGTVRTGAACSYHPDPGQPLDWDVNR